LTAKPGGIKSLAILSTRRKPSDRLTSYSLIKKPL
jgi:hypothetical protein